MTFPNVCSNTQEMTGISDEVRMTSKCTVPTMIWKDRSENNKKTESNFIPKPYTFIGASNSCTQNDSLSKNFSPNWYMVII